MNQIAHSEIPYEPPAYGECRIEHRKGSVYLVTMNDVYELEPEEAIVLGSRLSDAGERSHAKQAFKDDDGR